MEEITITTTEAGYLSGVTSAIQTQLDAKATSVNVVLLDGSQSPTAILGYASDLSGSMTASSDEIPSIKYVEDYVSPVLSGCMSNLTVQQDTDINHDINFYRSDTNYPAIVKVRDASYNTRTITWSSEMTKQTDATWALGDDAGGLDDNDTLSAEQTLYCFLLTQSDNSIDFGFTDDSTGVSLLTDAAVVSAGFTEISVVPVFAFLTDSSSDIRDFKAREIEGNGLEVRYDVCVGEKTDNPGTSAYLLTVPVPVNAIANINYVYYSYGVGVPTFALLTETWQTDTAPSINSFTLDIEWTSNNSANWNGEIKVDASRQIRSRISNSAANNGICLSTIGYKLARRL